MERFDTVIFDLDGTLLNTLEDLMDAVNYALALYGLPRRTLDEVRRFVGNGVKLLVERSVPGGAGHPEFDRVFDAFRSYYSVHCNDKTAAYSGVLELLHRLKERGYALAIVSNKLDSAVKELNKIYFNGIVDVAVGEREGVLRKPAPDMVNAALRELGREKGSAVYVGDSEVDVLTARNAGLSCISVLWGFRDRKFLEEKGASVFVNDPAEIEKLLLNNYKFQVKRL